MPNVVCMKWGTAYGPEYVNILHNMVRRHLKVPARFVCLTDDPSGLDAGVETMPLPEVPYPSTTVSPWRKLGLFAPRIGDLEGTTLFLDLDVVIVGALDPFFELPGRFCIIENWTQMGRGIGNSSVFRYEIGAHADLYEHYCRNMDDVVATYPNEQMFASAYIGDLTYWPAEWCVSFKRHCLPGGVRSWVQVPRLPERSRIVVFHGHPKPPDAIAGRWPGRLLKHVRPTPWVAENWR